MFLKNLKNKVDKNKPDSLENKNGTHIILAMYEETGKIDLRKL